MSRTMGEHTWLCDVDGCDECHRGSEAPGWVSVSMRDEHVRPGVPGIAMFYLCPQHAGELARLRAGNQSSTPRKTPGGTEVMSKAELEGRFRAKEGLRQAQAKRHESEAPKVHPFFRLAASRDYPLYWAMGCAAVAMVCSMIQVAIALAR